MMSYPSDVSLSIPPLLNTVSTVDIQTSTASSIKSSTSEVLLGAAAALIWGLLGGAIVYFSMPYIFPAKIPEPKIAVVDLTRIMSDYNQKALVNPNDQAAVSAALEQSAQAAAHLDQVMQYLVTKVHPHYLLIQPQALAYQDSHLPDLTNEVRDLLRQQILSTPVVGAMPVLSETPLSVNTNSKEPILTGTTVHANPIIPNTAKPLTP